VIVREITNCVLEKKEQEKKFLIHVCKSFFGKESILKKELDLYHALNESYNLETSVADKLLREAKYQYDMLNKQSIFNQQTKLINVLNKFSNGKIFSIFVPKYKNLATLSQIFNNTIPIKEKVLLENSLVSKMTSSPEDIEREKLQTLDTLTYKVFVKKFNEQYKEELLSEQKDLITKYVMSFADGGVEFKLYLNEEIERLKQTLKGCLETKQISENNFLKEKTVLVLQKVEKYKEKSIDSVMIKEVLKIQSLVKEINSEEQNNNG